MPFIGPNDPELPGNIKAQSEENRKTWVGAWNAAFQRCEIESGTDCEGKAFRIANSAIADTEQPMTEETVKNLFQFDLSLHDHNALVEGKPFDGMTHGDFIDAIGREVKVKKSELAEYVKNTQAAIEKTRTSEGIVGLPIDAANHDHGDAAGWIIAVELVGDIIRFTPRWTKLGLKKVGEGLRRMFSPSFSRVMKVIGGGSLTNWPATLNRKGEMLLSPIELTQGLYVAGAVESETPEEIAEASTTTTAETGANITINVDGKQLHMNLSTDDEPEPEKTGVEAMDEKELDARIEKQVQARVDAAVAELSVVPAVEPETEDVQTDQLAIISDLMSKGASAEDVEAAMIEWNKQNYAQMQLRADRTARVQLAKLKHDNAVADFSRDIVGGIEGHPYGIPTSEEKINTMLGDLEPEQAKEWMSVLSGIQTKGLILYEEVGHGKRLAGQAELASPFDDLLTSWVEGGGSVKEFFKLNAPELGEQEQYNLTAFETKSKEN